MQNIRFCSKGDVLISLPLSFTFGLTTSLPRRTKVKRMSGTMRQASDGRKTPFMIARVVIWPPIHSMVVVTSPIGVQAPPALAAMTMIPAKNSRSS
ncbi:MAG: hypothetical protein ACD_75C00272G0004 [uncultured bacterium]|nr:MAG: hypothetical protein ACD_75C00272G0004 [uncultured bacterium]